MHYVLTTDCCKIYFYVLECAKVFQMCLGGEIKEIQSAQMIN